MSGNPKQALVRNLAIYLKLVNDMCAMRCSRSRHVCAALLVMCCGQLESAHATTGLPPGFKDETVVTGLANPTAMQFSPDGRLFVAQQGGQLRVIKNGVLLPTPFLTLSVNSSGERGLLGVAFDPDFVTNQFLYVYYTARTPAVHNRISRFKALGDVRDTTVEEVVLLDFDNLSSATNHNGGALHFGLDGKLYAAHGDNANQDNAQRLDNLLGKIIRMNPVPPDPDPNAQIPTDNPFFTTASGKNRLIWTRGLRNPFTFSIQPGTGLTYVNDVGASTWEEINDARAGRNFGWPGTEGPFSGSPQFSQPVFSYPHSEGTPTGCAITGGAFYNPSAPAFPAVYVGKYFFSDFCADWIYYIDPANPSIATQFAANVSSPVDLKIGPDAALYYLARGTGSVGKITKLRGFSDFDGDGKADLTVFRPSSGTWFTAQSSTAYATPKVRQWALTGDTPQPGDYDGDGKTDIAVYRPSSGHWYILQSSTNDATVVVQQWGLTGDVPQPGDYDGDGKTDMAVYRPAVGRWFILKSSTNSVMVQQWGLAGDLPYPGDYDGDGKTDMAVHRPSSGHWYILKSSTNYTGVIVQQWGLPGDVPQPGDYDGDRKTDIAIYRPGSGQWFVLSSAANNSAVLMKQWGLDGDVPMPSDYDGDGKTDMAVYRPSTGRWYLLLSSTNFTPSIHQWGLPGDEPMVQR